MLPDIMASASQDQDQDQASQPLAAPPQPASTSPAEQPQPSPLPGKKSTRHWEAWTHQEEESFFSALRQVGKNFKKITSRIQSKNKDQVRHYYYRLIKRMNKLLGPGFVLDAKNSKDVNSAMLRWWSLLGKHSCPASKLHLKPRRFKNFVTALEHQLLKDRSKATKKRAQTAIPLSTAAMASRPISGKLCMEPLGVVAGGDSRPEKPTSSRGGGGKRKIEPRSNRAKGEPSRSSRQRKKSSDGSISAAAYKRWEKAASVGMTLVAEAAEQLERSAVSEGTKQLELVQTPIKSCLPSVSGCNVSQVIKLKLQLFPVDDFTRKSMENVGLNPHLQLTLNSRKAISSVLQHLTQKWGQASAASGELRLFPFNVQWKSLSCQSWSFRDVSISAKQVHALLGKPQLFRLKYGWIPHFMFESKNTDRQELPSTFISPSSCINKQGSESMEVLHGFPESCQKNGALNSSFGLPSSSVFIPNGNSIHSGIENTAEAESFKNLSNTYPLSVPFTENDCYNTASKSPSTAPALGLSLPSTSTLGPVTFSNAEGVRKSTLDTKDLHSSPCFFGKSNVSVQSEAINIPEETHCLNDKRNNPSEKTNSKCQENSSHCSWMQKESTDGFIHRLWSVENPSNNGASLQTEMDWIDSFMNISVGELLNEASRSGHNLTDYGLAQQMLHSLDSFDAAVAAQGAELSKIESRSLHQSQTPVWDGEDTCDGFSFHKLFCQKRESEPCSSVLENLSCQEIQKDSTGLITDFGSLEAWKQSFRETEIQCQELKSDACQSSKYNVDTLSGKDLISHELYWTDSLGTLDLAAPASERAQGQDALLSDDLSLGVLGGSSLDTFLAFSSQGNQQNVLSTPGFQMQSTCTKGNCSDNVQESTTSQNGRASIY